jgi:hypothetical protein
VTLVGRSPALALGSVAAAVFMVAFVHLRGEPELVMGLTSMTWEDPRGHSNLQPNPRLKGIPKEMHSGSARTQSVPESVATERKVTDRPDEGVTSPGMSRPRLAVVMLFKGFPAPLPQHRIDALYQALAPTAGMTERFDFVSPSDLDRTFRNTPQVRDRTKRLCQIVRKHCGASRILTLTVVSKDGRLELEGVVRDTETGRTIRETKSENVSPEQLVSRLRALELALLDVRSAP